MSGGRNKFGALIRRQRQAQQIGLREMAKKVGVSPTYLSRVERGELPAPAEDKVRSIAVVLNEEPDELLARAGRVASDVIKIVNQRPREMADFVRAARRLSANEFAQLVRRAQRLAEKKEN